MTIDELRKKADEIRDEVIRVACKNKCGHIASSLSTVDILVALYYQIMRPYKMQADGFLISNSTYNISEYANRDRLVLSKGHGCYALYAILANLGVIPKEQWERFGDNLQPPSVLKGCVEYRPEWGLEAGTGSLGHGLPMAVGMAYATKIQKLPWHTYCIVGDGELQEGSCWEALNFMFEQELKNITVIVDRNGFMALDKIEKNAIVTLFKGYGYFAINGHDIFNIVWMLESKEIDSRGMIIMADTIKGKGLKCMEGKAHFHYRVPTKNEICEGRTYE